MRVRENLGEMIVFISVYRISPQLSFAITKLSKLSHNLRIILDKLVIDDQIKNYDIFNELF